MIDKELVHRIAKLARLKLTDEEAQNFTGQLGSILEYIEQLNKVDTSEIEPTNFMAPLHDPLRDDTVVPSLSRNRFFKMDPVSKRPLLFPK